MEVKRLTTRITYRIEPRTGGGFVARSDDPKLPLLEAETREELQKKIQTAALAETFSGLQLPVKDGKFGLNAFVGRMPGGFTSGSTTVGIQQVKGATPEEIKQLTQELSESMGKNFPELSKALVAQIGNASHLSNSGRDITLDAPSPNSDRIGNVATSAPITPEKSRTFLPFVLVMLIAVVLAYFFLYHH